MKKEDKNNRHSRMSLSGIPTIANKQGGDLRQKPSGMTPNFTTVQGFTLIELLVVVLIIGILAAVALPQYQKAVVKSKNATLKQLLKTVANAQEVYYLANGKYAADFKELDVDLSLTPVQTIAGKTTGSCNITVQGTDSVRSGDGFFIVLHTSLSSLQTMTPSICWDMGKYQCACFGIGLAYRGGKDVRGQIHCRENINVNLYKEASGAFCQKVEGGEVKGVDGPWRYYKLPQ